MTDVDRRVAELEARLRDHRRAFDAPADPPDEKRAVRYLRDGFGQAVAVYVEARTGEGPPTAIEPGTFDRLETVLNGWLELYAACYGADIDAEFTVREAAELLVDTHDLRDVAQLLTKVPGRDEGGTNVK